LVARLGKRRRAREWVLRALYAGEMNAEAEEDPLALLLEHDPPREIDLEFARRLFAHVRSGGPALDTEIESQLENWDLSRLALIDLLLLRIALVEFECFPEIPYRVTLDETIELAKRYSGAQASGFVNGVLDAILHKRYRDVSSDSPAAHDQGTA
jgi:N utilization substance protein B